MARKGLLGSLQKLYELSEKPSHLDLPVLKRGFMSTPVPYHKHTKISNAVPALLLKEALEETVTLCVYMMPFPRLARHAQDFGLLPERFDPAAHVRGLAAPY